MNSNSLSKKHSKTKTMKRRRKGVSEGRRAKLTSSKQVTA